MGLVNAHERDYFQEAKNTVLMGFAMIEGIRELHKKDQSYSGLDMRIGIHTVSKKDRKFCLYFY